MCRGWSRSPAFSSRAATLSSPVSPRKNASRACESRTLADMAILQFALLALVLGPFLGERLAARLALEDAAQAADGVAGHGLDEDTVGGGLDDGLGALLDVEL